MLKSVYLLMRLLPLLMTIGYLLCILDLLNQYLIILTSFYLLFTSLFLVFLWLQKILSRTNNMIAQTGYTVIPICLFHLLFLTFFAFSPQSEQVTFVKTNQTGDQVTLLLNFVSILNRLMLSRFLTTTPIISILPVAMPARYSGW